MSLKQYFSILGVATLLLAGSQRAAGQAEEQEAGQAEEKEKDKDKDKEAKPAYGETVVVTASKTAEQIKNAPVAITVIGAEELATSPADNYGDLLRKVPGLNVTQLSARDINLTSRSSTSTLATSQLALVDGRSVYQDFFGFVAWDFLPINLDEIEQIEVIRGPGSAIWGANALTGVVNIITKRPRDMVGTRAKLVAGEIGTFEASVVNAGVNGRLGYKVSASYFEQDPFERSTTLPDGSPLPPAANFENQETKQPKLDLRFDYDQNDRERWVFSGGFAKTSGIIHTGIGPFDIDDSSVLGYVKGEYHRDALTVRSYLNLLDGDGKNQLNGLDFVFKNKTWDVEVTESRVIAERHALSYGGNVRSNFFDLSIAPLDDRRTELGAFFQDNIFLNDTFRLNLGGRVDWFDTIGATFSPRTSLLIRPHPDHTFRVSYNRAYRAPSLVNNFLSTSIPNAIQLPTGQTFVFPIAAVGNPDLNEETLDAIELGYTAILDQRATLTLAVYFNRTRDVIDFFANRFYSAAEPPPGWPLPPMFVPPFTLPSSFTYRNIGQIDDRGFEAGIDVDLTDRVSAGFNYSFQAEPDVTNADSPIPLEINIPARHRFNLSASYVDDLFQGSLALSWTDEALWTDVLDARFHGTTNSFAMLNGSFGVKLAKGKLQLGVKGTNLTDERIQQHVFGDIIARKVVFEARTTF